ncbi:MAG: hypothetical protein D6781_14150, partial [Verrucomicrobia bacterium]
ASTVQATAQSQLLRPRAGSKDGSVFFELAVFLRFAISVGLYLNHFGEAMTNLRPVFLARGGRL